MWENITTASYIAGLMLPGQYCRFTCGDGDVQVERSIKAYFICTVRILDVNGRSVCFARSSLRGNLAAPKLESESARG